MVADERVHLEELRTLLLLVARPRQPRMAFFFPFIPVKWANRAPQPRTLPTLPEQQQRRRRYQRSKYLARLAPHAFQPSSCTNSPSPRTSLAHQVAASPLQRGVGEVYGNCPRTRSCESQSPARSCAQNHRSSPIPHPEDGVIQSALAGMSAPPHPRQRASN